MDEVEQRVLEAKLASVDREWKRLSVIRDFLLQELGRTGTDEDQRAVPHPGSSDSEPSALINEGEFFGMSGPKAARLVLERVGRQRPLKTDVLFEAIRKGGVKLGSSAVLYRSLTRDDDFIKVGRGVWALSAWHPNAARKTKRPADNGGTDAATDSDENETVAGPPPVDHPAREPAKD